MIIVNPEFHRHLWLNFSPFRLIAMPALLSLVIYAFSQSTLANWQAGMLLPSLWSYCIIVFLWGNYEAASSTSRDVSANIWDFQRMSAIRPWSLVIGKLFGATSYVWYAGILSLIIFVYSYQYIGDIEVFSDFYALYPDPVKPVLYLIFAGVMGHATSLFLSIGNMRRNGTPSFAGAFIFGFITSCTIISMTMELDIEGQIRNNFSEITWHGFTFEKHAFVLTSLAYFFGWIVIAIQRNLRHELQYKNSPIVLMVFLVTFCIYLTGFAGNKLMNIDEMRNNVLAGQFFLSFIVLASATYAAVFAEAGNVAKYKRWFYALKNKEWKRTLEYMPTWVGCLVLLVPVYIVFNIQALYIQENSRILKVSEVLSVFSLTSAVLLFMIRDGLVLHSILATSIERHQAFILGLFYVLAYGLIPYIALTGVQGMDSYKYIVVSFYPIGGASFWEGCLPVMGQICVALAVFYYLKHKSISQKMS